MKKIALFVAAAAMFVGTASATEYHHQPRTVTNTGSAAVDLSGYAGAHAHGAQTSTAAGVMGAYNFAYQQPRTDNFVGIAGMYSAYGEGPHRSSATGFTGGQANWNFVTPAPGFNH